MRSFTAIELNCDYISLMGHKKVMITELQSALSQSQQRAKQKAVETKELQGRLKAQREKKLDLERNLKRSTALAKASPRGKV